MAKKAKRNRVSVSCFEKVAKNGIPETKTIEWEGVEVEIKPTLSLGEVYGFVNGVVAACVNTETGVYNAEIKDVAIKMMVLENYANFTLPRSSEKSYDLIYRTDAFYQVLNNINTVQFDEICKAIDAKIEYALRSNIDVANRKINEIVSSMSGIQEQLSSLLSEVSDEDIKNIINALTSGKLDEEKMMNAYLDRTSSEQASVPTLVK